MGSIPVCSTYQLLYKYEVNGYYSKGVYDRHTHHAN